MISLGILRHNMCRNFELEDFVTDHKGEGKSWNSYLYLNFKDVYRVLDKFGN